MLMNKQRGLSLVELMVALVLGLVLMGGVIQVMTTSQRSYTELVQQARMQESAKLAMDYIVRDLRNVGYWGCTGNAIPVANAVNNTTWDVSNILRGWRETETTVPAAYASATADSDIIEMRYVDLNNPFAVTGQTLAVLGVDRAHNQNDGTVWAVVDSNCAGMGVFVQQSTAPLAGDIIQFAANTGAGLQNCQASIRGRFNCTVLAGGGGLTDVRQYSVGSSAYVMQDIAYYLDDATNTLIRRENGVDVPLLNGIAGLNFIYGLDTNDSGAVDQFADAATINAAFTDSNGDGVCDVTALCFWQVLTVTLEVTVMPEGNDMGVPNETFTSTLRLRNRGLS